MEKSNEQDKAKSAMRRMRDIIVASLGFSVLARTAEIIPQFISIRVMEKAASSFFLKGRNLRSARGASCIGKISPRRFAPAVARSRILCKLWAWRKAMHADRVEFSWDT